MRRGSRAVVPAPSPVYPGVLAIVDGATAVVRAASGAVEAGVMLPILPASRIGEAWAAAAATGGTTADGQPLLVLEAQDPAAAAATTAGLSLAGLRATCFASGAALPEMRAALGVAAGRRLPYVLHVACRALPGQGVSSHVAHDDYHAVDDAGVFQLFAASVQEAADLALVAHRVAELSLTPGVCAQDGLLTTHTLERVRLPERSLAREYLGDPADLIQPPTPAQRLIFGDERRRVPEWFDLDYPALLGPVQGPDSYQQGVAAQRPFFFDHVAGLADQAFAEYGTLTGRHYARATGYRLEDAEYVLVAQGAVVAEAQAVCDHLRERRKLRVGVLQLTMFRPFPADLVTGMLRGTRAVLVLERVDQPLGVDPPILRDIRAAMAQGVENWRGRTAPPPYAAVPACPPDDVPDFYSGCFGLGGRPLEAGDLVAAVDRVVTGGARRRQFYLGIEFARPRTRLPKLQIWQERVLAAYPGLADFAIPPTPRLDLAPGGARSLRVHSLGGADTATLGRVLAVGAALVLRLHVTGRPADDARQRGRPALYRATLAAEPVRASDAERPADVVVCPDPTWLAQSAPFRGLAAGAVVLGQHGGRDAEAWGRLPGESRRAVAAAGARLVGVDAEAIAAEEAPEPALRPPVQAAAFLGALLRVASLPGAPELDPAAVVGAVRERVAATLGLQDSAAVEAWARAAGRGFAEARELGAPADEPPCASPAPLPERPAVLDVPAARPGPGHPGRFWEQVGYLDRTGRDGIADPFAALGVLPAATSAIRDASVARASVPELVPARCDGCGECWTQCPQSAIPGLVTPVEDMITVAVRSADEGPALDPMRPLVKPLAAEVRRLLTAGPVAGLGDVLTAAYGRVAEQLGVDPERRATLDARFERLHAAVRDLPLARTAAFFDGPEARARGTGGLLSVTVDPDACNGCGVCVEVCGPGALRLVPQTDDVLARLRRNWRLWQELPDTDDRYLDVPDHGDGLALRALLLKKGTHAALRGGDVACPGCGEKTALHLVLAAVHALLRPRVRAHVARLDALIARLDDKGRELVASDADLHRLAASPRGTVELPLAQDKQAHVERIARLIADLRDLRWRYVEGPGGRGRATAGIANATGCSAAWAAASPLNPYPIPWVSQPFAGAPSLALGLFEGHMRKMAGGFRAVRRAELELAGEYEPGTHDPELARLDWRGFSDDELALCPPILAVGGDAAMLDAGLHDLSRVLASGRPLRVVVLDTQAGSAAGGTWSTAGLIGQRSAADGGGPGGPAHESPRKEAALLGMAHRGVFVLQSSAAAPAHLLGGVLRGLASRAPALFHLYCVCPPVHGLEPATGPASARLAVETRVVPLLVYDPAAGSTPGERLSLAGNPAPDEAWPSRDVRYVDETGAEQVLRVPVTTADWAATEGRFRGQLGPMPADGDGEPIPLSAYLELPRESRAGKVPFVYTVDGGRRLGRLAVSDALVRLAEDRQEVWTLLRATAGLKPPATVVLEADFERRLAAMRAEYEGKLADLKARYPQLIARRLAERLLRAGDGEAVGELLGRVRPAVRPPADGPATPAAPAAPAVAAPAAPPAPAEPKTAVGIALEPYIDSTLCTACNECTTLNKRMFAYNAQKQAYIKDPRASTFKQLVQAAEKCPVRIIHPGTPLDPTEKDLDKWVARAKPFN